MSVAEATGLPDLPADHIWRVKADRLQIVLAVAAGEWSQWTERERWDGMSAYYAGHEVQTEEHSRTFDRRVGVWPFVRTVAQVEKFMVSRSRKRADKVVVAESKFGERAIKRVPDGTDSVRTPGSYPYYYGGYSHVTKYRDVEVVVKEDPITSANLLERALVLFDKWQTVGDYPPKKLAS